MCVGVCGCCFVGLRKTTVLEITNPIVLINGGGVNEVQACALMFVVWMHGWSLVVFVNRSWSASALLAFSAMNRNIYRN